jgi:hypothetical protein
MATNGVTTKPTPDALAAIHALDLECIKVRMMDQEIGKGWTRAYADAVERRYKRFLVLAVKYPDLAEELVIDRDVDEFWHAHILHTVKYAEDCEHVFGCFLHHRPHRRTGSDSEAAERALRAQRTRVLHKLEFGGDTGGSVREDYAYRGAAAMPEKAYCGIATFDAKQAYCGVSFSGADHAYCGIAKARADAACVGTAPTPEQAYCGLGAAPNEHAYCGIAATSHSYCGIAIKGPRTPSSDQ